LALDVVTWVDLMMVGNNAHVVARCAQSYYGRSSRVGCVREVDMRACLTQGGMLENGGIDVAICCGVCYDDAPERCVCGDCEGSEPDVAAEVARSVPP